MVNYRNLKTAGSTQHAAGSSSGLKPAGSTQHAADSRRQAAGSSSGLKSASSTQHATRSSSELKPASSNLEAIEKFSLPGDARARKLRAFYGLLPAACRLLPAALMLVLGLVSVAAAQTPSVRLSASPAANTVTAGSTASYNVAITRTNYTDKVTLAATGLPTGATAAFTPNQTTGASSVLKITTTTATPAGTYSIKITGAATGLTIDPLFVSLQVKAPPSVSLTTDAEVQCIMAGQSATYAVDIQRTNFDGPLTFTASNVPAGVTALFEPTTTSGSRVYFRLNTPFNAGADFGEVVIKAQGSGLTGQRTIRIYINCGIRWTAQTGSSATENPPTPNFEVQSKITTDSIGNSYVVGSTNGGMEGTSGANAGNTDVFLIKYDANGNRLWTQQFGGPNQDRATEVKADGAGNVYLAGYTDGAIDPQNPVTFGNFDVWLAKFDANGNRLALRQLGDGAGQGPYGIELQPTANGVNLYYVTGRVGATVSKYALDASLNGPQSLSIRINAFTINVNELAVGADGSFAVVGHDAVFNNTNNTHVSLGIVAKYDANGNLVWNRQFGVFGRDERANRAALDSQGNVFVTGCRLSGVAQMTPSDAACSNATTALNGANEDAWVKKLNGANGNELWERSFTTPARDVIGGVEVRDYAVAGGLTRQRVYLVGLTERALLFASGGGEDMWLARYEDDGSRAVVGQLGNIGNDRGLTLAVDNNGYILASGTTTGFFGRPNTLGSTDIWVMKYGPDSFPSHYISSFTSGSGPVGTSVTITGNFASTVTEVAFGGVRAQFTRLSATQIRANVPVGAVSGRIAINQIVPASQCPTIVSDTNFIVQ